MIWNTVKQFRNVSFRNAQIGTASFRAFATTPRHMRVDGRVREITFHYGNCPDTPPRAICQARSPNGAAHLGPAPMVRVSGQ